MTIEEKSLEIAKMLGWIDKDGDLILPRHLAVGYNYPEWADTKEVEHPELYNGCKLTHYINVGGSGFLTDANWQFEAINWIHNIKLGDYYLYFVQIGRKSCSIRSEEHAINSYRKLNKEAWKHFYSECAIADTPIEAIFEALYEFSQYIKNK